MDAVTLRVPKSVLNVTAPRSDQRRVIFSIVTPRILQLPQGEAEHHTLARGAKANNPGRHSLSNCAYL